MYSDSSHWCSVNRWMIYNKLPLNTSEQLFNSKCCHMLEQVVQEDPGVSLLALADPPFGRRAGLPTQVFCGFINAKCQKREGYVSVIAPMQWCPMQEVLVSQPNWCSCKLHWLCKSGRNWQRQPWNQAFLSRPTSSDATAVKNAAECKALC